VAASAPGAIAIGGSDGMMAGAMANAAGAVAIGTGSVANMQNDVAVGYANSASGPGAVALGSYQSATGAGAVAIGDPNVATGTGAVAIGANNTATGNGAVAIGNQNTATGNGSVAIGQNSMATGTNSVAIGNGVMATGNNQVVLGAPGVLQASTASQVGSTNFVTSDKNGTLGVSQFGPGNIASLQNSVSSLFAGQQGLQNQIYDLQRGVRRGYEGTAVALATQGAILPDGKQFAVSAHWGEFRGQNALGGNVQARVSQNIVLDAGVGVGLNYGGVGARAGATYAW
ncbi:MAG: YadA-like family protein, partial [Methylocystis sp.]